MGFEQGENYQIANSRNQTQTITTTSVKISEMLRPGIREAIILGNNSVGGQVLTISIGTPSAANAGIVLLPGAVWSEYQDARFDPTNDTIYCISSAAGGILTIYERIKVIQ